MGFIRTAIKRPVTIFMILLCVLLFGVMAIFNMPVTLLPDMNMPMLTVVTAYPGASPEDVEADVTGTLERELKTMSGLTSIQTYSLDNLSAILLEFEFGSDTDKLAQDVRGKLELVGLPSGCESPIVQNIDLNAMPIAKIAVRAEDAETLAEEEISPAIERIAGVSSVKTVGAKSQKIEIVPKDQVFGIELPATLSLLMAQAISSGAYDLPLGSVTEDGKIVTVRNVSEITSVEELKNLPISVPFGGTTRPLPLSMLADISDPIDVYESGKATVNGESCLILSVYKLQDGNTTSIVQAVKDRIAEFNRTEGVELTLVDDQSQYISDSISSVWSSLAIGAVLAFLIILLFLANVKSSLIIALSMPLSVLLALICLYAMGISLNLVSLGGLALGVGMLVDNSIVVIESITRRREELGEPPAEAAAKGAKSVAGSILASTLTSVAVFVPILFVKGMTEEIFRDLSFSVIFSLAFSLIVALSVIPSMYAKFGGRLRKKKQKEESQTEVSPESAGQAETVAVAEEEPVTQPNAEVSEESVAPARAKKSLMKKTEEAFGKLLHLSLGKRWVVLTLAFVFFGASVGLLFTTGQEFLPAMERGVVEVTVETEEGTVESTEQKLLEVAALIRENFPEVQTVTTSIESGNILDLGTRGSIGIKLKEGARRSKVVANEMRSVLAGVQGAQVTARAIDGVVEMLMNGTSGVSISVNGKDEETLKKIQTEILAQAKEIRGVTSVTGSLGERQEQLRIHLDQTKLANAATAHGMADVNYEMLVRTLRVGLAGFGADARIGGQKTELSVSLGGLTSEEEIKNLLIFPQTGTGEQTVPAVRLVDLLGERGIERAEVPTVIKKQNGNLTLEISADIYGVDSGSVEKEIKRIATEVLSSPDYEGYVMASSGVTKYLGEAFSGLVIALLISLFLVFAIMASQFESLKKPFVIMFSIPFAFTGGFLALAITRTTLNVVSFVGVIMLIGVIINNAIVMIDKIEELKNQGMDPEEAVLAGATARLRPILMTTLTTVLALVPLALGIGKGSELLQPMGIVVIGGMLLGTLVTLVLIPTVYTLIARVKIKRGKKGEKDGRTEEDAQEENRT